MTIAQIKQSLSLNTVLNHYNLSPDRNNRLSCPWHPDKTPSLQVYPATNSWTCFSSNCNAGSGDQIDFIMKYEKISKHEAILKAQSMLGEVEVKDPLAKIKARQADELARIAVLTKFYQKSMEQMAKTEKAQAYAQDRGLAWQDLGVGYAGYEMSRSWNGVLKKQAEGLGLLKLKNCLIFAMRNELGQVVSIYGRSIAKTVKSKHFYLAGGHQGLYPKYPSLNTKVLIICESIIDAASVHKGLGSDCAVLALYGTNGFTVDHGLLIKKLDSLEEVILFFDGDAAGQAAVERVGRLVRLNQPRVKISRVPTPDGEDANSMLVAHEPEIISHLLDQRRTLDIGAMMPEHEGIGQLDTQNPELLRYQTDGVSISLMGGIKITGLDRLRVILKIEVSGHLPIRHSLDLYHAGQVEQLAKKVAERLEIPQNTVEKTLNHLTGALEQYREQKAEQMRSKKVEKVEVSQSDKAVALKYLRDPQLLRNTLNDLAASGIVGETSNALIAYLTYTSRKRERPLHVMCLGASGTGKTYLQEKVSELVPGEDKIEITSLSDNAFYYFGREELKHKLILIEDLDGAENVLYPLRELQSKRRISKTVTLKDNKGNLKTVSLRVEGPVCVSSCTTRERIYEDNANRCILLYIDDSKKQDQLIMAYQKKMSAGSVDQALELAIQTKLQNVQRALHPIRVVNPYADLIDLPAEVFKPRRTLLLLLSFIETITFYHQYQRPVKKANDGSHYIETIPEDVEAAFSLLKGVLFQKSDELSGAGRKFFERLKKLKPAGTIFGAKEIRLQMRLSPSSLQRHLYELQRYGYLKVKGGSRHRGYEYEIIDYKEYEGLKGRIDQKLAQIMQVIKASPKAKSLNNKVPSNPVAQ